MELEHVPDTCTRGDAPGFDIQAFSLMYIIRFQPERLTLHSQGHRPWYIIRKKAPYKIRNKTIKNHFIKMGQSLAQIYIHLVFATKHRETTISEAIEPQLYTYIAGILKALQSPLLGINSVPDHIHILFRLSKNYPLAKVVEEVKKQSSKWLKIQPEGHPQFTWQVGYGAFSVSSSKLETVKKYIANQKQHHQVCTLKAEIEEFVKQYEIADYNEIYFWE